MDGKDLFEQAVAAIEVTWKKRQGGVGLGQRLALVAGFAPKKCRGERNLGLDDRSLILSLEKKANHGIDEEPVVERLEHRADGRLTTHGLESRGHPKTTSMPTAPLTI